MFLFIAGLGVGIVIGCIITIFAIVSFENGNVGLK